MAQMPALIPKEVQAQTVVNTDKDRKKHSDYIFNL
jgi:hypothetical protein